MKTQRLQAQLRGGDEVACCQRSDYDTSRGSLQTLTTALHRTANMLVRRRHRRIAITELKRLRDEQLADIGIRRERIPDVVDAMLDSDRAGDPMRRGRRSS